MQSLKSLVETAARTAIIQALGSDFDPIVRWSSQPKFGDLQINAAMSIAKTTGEKPHEVAQKIVDALDLTGISNEPPEIAGPGFINITLSSSALQEYVLSSLNNASAGVEPTFPAQRIVIDYGGANIAKEMHVGHIRSAIIGDALVRIFSFLGNTVIKQDHLGDWGTQFGMLVEFLSTDGVIPTIMPDLGDLNEFYKQAQTRFKSDEDFATRARARVALLQGGDEDSLRAWTHIYDQTMKHLLNMYSRLGILLSADDSRGESFYNDMLSDVCTELQNKGIAVIDDGALCIYSNGVLDRDGNPFGLIIRKSDGGYGYGTTDLAALKYNVEHDKADRVIYAVDARQSQHFQIIFDAAARAGWIDNTHPEHAAFGSILGEDGTPFKTRSGDVVKLGDVLDEALERADSLLQERSSELNESERLNVATSIGVGALKYADLSNNRVKNYVFDWDRMLAMEGNTSPYLQYAIARINSLLAKASDQKIAFDDAEIFVNSPYERELVKNISMFSETLHDVAETLEPHRLCTYLFDLAQSFSGFYENCPVLKESDETLRASRLILSNLVARTLRIGLDLLGIDSPERL